MKIIEELRAWEGIVEINGVMYENISEAEISLSSTPVAIESIILYNSVKSVSKRKILRSTLAVDTSNTIYKQEIDSEELR